MSAAASERLVSRNHRHAVRGPASRWSVLAVLCLAVFLINIDTTIVNVALPTLVTDLGASNSQLQWIVDNYNLFFAALVLAAGSLGDRRGRRGTLVTGLAVFGAAAVAAALCRTADQLIVARAAMGVGAALIFPTTLSILSNVFTERAARAKAIGIWGATTGIGVAFGPITGGWLLEHFAWGSIFWLKAPIAALAIALTLWLVPTSRDPSTAPFDRRGLVLSTVLLGTLVYTIIEAPSWGWTSWRTLAGATAVAVAGGRVRRLGAARGGAHARRAPVRQPQVHGGERLGDRGVLRPVRVHLPDHPVLPVPEGLQPPRHRRPHPAGGALHRGRVADRNPRGRPPRHQAGGRLGPRAPRRWPSPGSRPSSVGTTYTEIAAQMVVLGTGLGLTSAPATEAIMGVVPKEKAGIGSAVNDATRELGGTLGVAVIGSVFASLYAGALSGGALAGVPAAAAGPARESVGAALAAAARLGASGAPEAAARLSAAASGGFFDGLQAGCLLAAGVCLAGAAVAALVLPAQPVALVHEAAEGA